MKELSEDLMYTVKGEILGESFFRSAYLVSRAEFKRKMKVLWQLETQTKNRLSIYLEENSMAAPSPILEKLKGLVSGFVWALWIPRSFGMKFLRPDTDRALEVYRRLVRGAEEADRALFDYVVEHEMAIREFAEMELAGRGRQSIERAAALIA